MSAFMCDDRHISALACYAAEHLQAIWHRSAQEFAELLHAENVRSVNARYNRSDEPIFTFEFVDVRNVSQIRVIKAAHCYAYQSCEHDGWEHSEAKRVIEAIESEAASRLPDYDAAPWGWD